MDIRDIITEEIAEFIKALDDQKKKTQAAVHGYERENNPAVKLKKAMRAEMEKQKLYKIQAKLLKEKVDSSKKTQGELRAKLDVMRKSRT